MVKSMKRKRYLFNCLKDPRQATRVISGWWRSRIERNPGDLAYEYSVMNALATDASVEFIPTGYYNFRGFPDAKIEEINETCAAFVCPLADVFSDGFIPLVRRLTELVRQLRIPCIVPCVGLRATEGEWSPHAPEFDEIVRAFVRAILDKSSKIGVRGETTGRYLERLGFSRERDFVVVGCPSMYTYGTTLLQRALQPPQNFGRCAFSLNQRASERDWRFINGFADQFHEAVFVSQHYRVFEQFMLTNGRHTSNVVESRPVFKALLQKYASENRMRFFLNRKPWMDFLGSMDLSFGHRIHGALLSILAGTPAVVIPFETRTEELARFHGIPVAFAPAMPLDWRKTSVGKFLERLDFSSPERRQRENFANWLSFLHSNGLETVFDRMSNTGGGEIERSEFPLEGALPRRFPDDDIKAWRFNGMPLRARMTAAVGGALGRRICGSVACRVKMALTTVGLRNASQTAP